jgi:bacteriorhodopsin
MTPIQLHEAWLVVTVITTMTIGGIAIYLLATFRRSNRRWFFWAIAMAFVSISFEQLCAEVKNYYQAEPPLLDTNLLKFWLAGRVQEAVITGSVLCYLVFGRNGKTKTAVSEGDNYNAD